MTHRLLAAIAGLILAVRQWLAGLPARWIAWREGLRQDPSLLWRTPLVRLAGLLLGGIVLVLGVNWFIGVLTLGGSSLKVEEPTPWATLHVACANPACRAVSKTRQPMDFKAWPLKCEKCGQMSVYRAARCPVCRHWYVNPPDGQGGCPFCRERKATTQSRPADRKTKSVPEDAEDPW